MQIAQLSITIHSMRVDVLVLLDFQFWAIFWAISIYTNQQLKVVNIPFHTFCYGGTPFSSLQSISRKFEDEESLDDLSLSLKGFSDTENRKYHALFY